MMMQRKRPEGLLLVINVELFRIVHIVVFLMPYWFAYLSISRCKYKALSLSMLPLASTVLFSFDIKPFKKFFLPTGNSFMKPSISSVISSIESLFIFLLSFTSFSFCMLRFIASIASPVNPYIVKTDTMKNKEFAIVSATPISISFSG